MTTENQVSAAEETQIQSAEELANEIPEVAEPETEETQVESHEPETGDERDKTIRRLQRRIDKKHADAAVAAERARVAEERLAQLTSQAESKPEPEDKPQKRQEVDPVVLAGQIARINEINAKSNTIAADGKKRFPDWKDALTTVGEELGALFYPNGHVTPIGEALVIDAEDPAKLLHYLGTNPEIASELVGLSPTKLGRQIERIEASLKAKPKASSAPKPLTPVRAAAASNDLSDDLSPEEWRRRRDKAVRGR